MWNSERTDAAGRREKAILWAGFLFAFSFQKYLTRDPLSPSTGLQGVIESGLTLLSALIILLSSRHRPKRIGLHIAVFLFGVYGIFALVSSVNSFNVVLSAAKGVLFLSVLASAYFLSELDMAVTFLNGVYRGYIVTLLGGLALGFLSPARFPLVMADIHTGRTRLSLLATHPNSTAEVTGLLFLLALVLPMRTRWYWQLFLLAINILAGEKTATAALFLSSVLIFLFGRGRVSRKRVLTYGAAAVVAVGSLMVFAGPTRLFTQGADAIYGHEVSGELGSLDGRIAVWKSGAELAENCILLGYGFEGARNSLLSEVSWSGQAHNGILQATLSAGLFGMLALVGGWLAAFRGSLTGDRSWNFRVIGLHFYLFCLAMIGPIFDSPSYFTILLFVVTLYVALSARQAHQDFRHHTFPEAGFPFADEIREGSPLLSSPSLRSESL